MSKHDHSRAENAAAAAAAALAAEDAGKKVKKAAKGKGLKDKAKSDENPRRLMVYAGVSLDRKHRLNHIYHVVDENWREVEFNDRVQGFDDDPDGEKTLWYGKRFGYATPGTVISIEYNAENPGTVYRNTVKQIGQYPEDLCRQWSAGSRAVEDAKAGVSAMKKAEKESKDAFAELLEPIRRAYHECRSETQRVAMLNRIHAIITRRRKGDRFKLYL